MIILSGIGVAADRLPSLIYFLPPVDGVQKFDIFLYDLLMLFNNFDDGRIMQLGGLITRNFI
jgi:hypothetical protein